jgi:hypothetical protein
LAPKLPPERPRRSKQISNAHQVGDCREASTTKKTWAHKPSATHIATATSGD